MYALSTFRVFLAMLPALASAGALAASSGQPVTPVNVSVAGGETRVFSARFYDSLGRPAVGETVRFANDVCGTFPDGGYYAQAVTDATGLASITFRAFNQGITCWLVANAGVQVKFDVLTFVAANAYLSATKTPANPLPGQPYTVTVAAKAGLYNLYQAEIAARVVDGSASAFISPGSANSGERGTVSFAVTPDSRIGDYQLEFQFRNRVQRLAIAAPLAPWQDLWWAGMGENGWGMSIVQHRDALFSVLYVYDAGGKATWYVMPSGTWNDARTAFKGPLYAPQGTPFSDYDAAALAVGAPVGSATLTFAGSNELTLDYAIGAQSGRKNVTRQLFGAADASAGASHGDMWWGGVEQNGWGIALLQQHRALFGVWFTYDAAGSPTWFAMPAGTWTDAGTYEGKLYSTVGAPWLGKAYDATAFRSTDVGFFRFKFKGDEASFEYQVNGKGAAIPLSRTPF